MQVPSAKELKRRYDEDGWVVLLGVFPIVGVVCLVLQAWGGAAILFGGTIGQLLVYRRMCRWPFER